MSRSIATAAAFTAGILLTSPSVAFADWTDCKQLTDVNLRLLCYDEAANEAGANTKTADKIPNTPTPDTKISATNPQDFKPVDADDIYVAPRKYIGKPIEIQNTSCLYIDVGDYRCITGSSVTIFAKSVTPEATKGDFEEACGSMKKLMSKSCRKTIRIVPAEYSQDEVDGNQKRIVIRSEAIELVSDNTAPKKKR